MKLIPAIDLRDGNCVRLLKGDFAQTTKYSEDPLAVARQFSALNVDDLHVVDLDGARTGDQANLEVVRDITAATPLSVQLGGGIRALSDVETWLANGVERCVIGSSAVDRADEVRGWFGDVGSDRIVLALDVRFVGEEPILTTHGWTQSSSQTLWSVIEFYMSAGLQHVLCTDVSRDGAMAGPNLELYAEALRRFPGLKLQASGGVRDIGDLEKLRALGVPAAISGRALLDGKITEQEISSFRQSA